VSRTMTVLALARSTGGYYHGELLSGLIREVTAAGGQVVVANTVDPGTQNVDTFGVSQLSLPVAWDEVDGVVAVGLATTGPYLDRLRALGKPVVLASHHVDGSTPRSPCRITTAGCVPGWSTSSRTATPASGSSAP